MKNSGIGGQAVIEGVMMKNGGKYAVAVRKPDGEIAVETKECTDPATRNAFFKLPVIRGVVAFIDSLSLGMSTLTLAASYFTEDEEESKFEKKLNEITKGKADKIIDAVTIIFSVLLAVVIFVLVPVLLSRLVEKVLKNQVLLGLIEGLIRVAIFILYIFLISRIKDIKRMFMYHGAEHKCINCIESGRELTVKNVKKASKEHKRCGTSFMLNVMILSIIFFMVIRVDNTLLKLALRLILIPVIAGLSYEFSRLAGKSDNKVVNALSKPGLLMQRLTTKEPDEKMIEVGIKSVEAVFDWKAFIENKSDKPAEKTEKTDKSGKKEKAQKTSDKAIVMEDKPVEIPTEDTVKAAEEENKQETVKAPAQEKPLEVDIAKLFDIKIPDVDDSKPKHVWKTKHEEEPKAAVVSSGNYEDDEILAALDFMFEYNGPKTEVEISDDPNVVVTGADNAFVAEAGNDENKDTETEKV